MFKRYLISAKRKFIKQPLNTVMNIIGLSSAFAFSLLIAAFVWQELNVNAAVKNIDRQYLIQSEITGITTTGLLAPTLREEYPQLVEDYFRFDGIQSILSYDNKSYSFSAAIGDSTFFNVFGFSLLDGDIQTALSRPDQVVITYQAAIQLFGTTHDIIGNEVQISNFNDEKKPFVVSGVLQALSENSIINLIEDDPSQIIFPTSSSEFLGRNLNTWNNPYIASYITLKEGILPQQVESLIEKTISTHLPEDEIRNLGETRLHNLKSYHLEKENGSIKKMLYILVLIGFFILLMATVNFINITTNTAAKRLKAISIRKVLGADIWHLRIEIFAEALLIVSISCLLAVLCYPILSSFGLQIFGKPLPLLKEIDPLFWMFILFTCMIISFLAGIYPAFRLSALPITNAVKGVISYPIDKTFVHKGLVCFQFIVTLTILICSAYVFTQIQLLYSQKLGYDKDLLVTVPTPRNWSEAGLEKMNAIRDRLALNSSVESISLSYDVPTAMGSGLYVFKENSSNEKELYAQVIFSDEHFSETYKIPTLSGDFSFEHGIVVNSNMAKSLGFENPVQAVGQTVFSKDYTRSLEIAAVTDDFYSNSLRHPVLNTVWFPLDFKPMYRYFTIRLASNDVTSQLRGLEKEWSRLLPGEPFSYRFLDERLAMEYNLENRVKQATVISIFLTMIILLLGVFSLLSQKIEISIKEIGIRKVLGAKAFQINSLFMKDIGAIFLVAVPIAVLISYLLVYKWLENFQEKTSVNFIKTVIPIIGLATIVIVLIVVKIYKAARANPVDSLRDE